MSHDIRNPLTALLGYLDLARGGQYRSEGELRQYLEASYSKAEQLKTLTDELFRYALVFGGQELNLDMQEYDAEILLEQLLFEPIMALEQHGFHIQTAHPALRCRIRLDVTYFQRVLDNLFDNLRKYADPAAPVAITAMEEDGWLQLCIGNTRKKTPAWSRATRSGSRPASAFSRRWAASSAAMSRASGFPWRCRCRSCRAARKKFQISYKFPAQLKNFLKLGAQGFRFAKTLLE